VRLEIVDQQLAEAAFLRSFCSAVSEGPEASSSSSSNSGDVDGSSSPRSDDPAAAAPRIAVRSTRP
jgi:hypothetical protein